MTACKIYVRHHWWEGVLISCPIFRVWWGRSRLPHQERGRAGNRYVQLRDTFGALFDSRDFQHLFSSEGRPAEDPSRLAVITILQFVERLSDEQAADAVRSRIDWKCATRCRIG